MAFSGFALVGTGIGHAALGRIPFDVLVTEAALIVQGTVESVCTTTQPPEPAPGAHQEAGPIATNFASLSVSRVFKGSPGVRSVRIAYPAVEDSPRYKPGETVIVFLDRTDERDTFVTIGLSQGRYLVTADAQVERERIPVEEFVRRMEVLLKRETAVDRSIPSPALHKR